MGSLSEPEYGNAVKRIYSSLNELFEMGAAVRQTMQSPGWVHISRLLEEKIAEIDFELDGQLLDTRARYAHLHGKRHGLRAMDQAARAIVSKADSKLAEQQAIYDGAAESEPVGASR